MKTIILGLALALVACGKKNEDKQAPPPPPPAGSAATGSAAGSAMAGSGAGSAMAGSAAGSAAAAANVDVPTEMDFEAAAKTDVTDKNVDTKVKAIEDQLP